MDSVPTEIECTSPWGGKENFHPNIPCISAANKVLGECKRLSTDCKEDLELLSGSVWERRHKFTNEFFHEFKLQTKRRCLEAGKSVAKRAVYVAQGCDPKT